MFDMDFSLKQKTGCIVPSMFTAALQKPAILNWLSTTALLKTLNSSVLMIFFFTRNAGRYLKLYINKGPDLAIKPTFGT